jgi:hypothetical protein
MASTIAPGWRRVPLWDAAPAPATTPHPASLLALADGSADVATAAAGNACGAAVGTASGRLTLLDPAGFAPTRAGVAHAGGLVAAVAVQVRGVRQDARQV